MDFSKAGLILNTEKYAECVNFYGDILGLDLLFEINRPGEQLTCFDLGGIYLMIETGGYSHSNVKPIDKCPTKFRFNVPNVDAVCTELRSKLMSTCWKYLIPLALVNLACIGLWTSLQGG